MPIHQVLRLGRGAIIELDSSEEDEVRILANNMPVAKGTVVVSGNRIAVEVKELLPAPRRRRYRAAIQGYPVCGLVRGEASCYIRGRAPNAVRVHPTCGRGGIGRRTSLRC